MPLEIQVQRNVTGPTTTQFTVGLSGSLDTATAPELDLRLKPVLASVDTRHLVFDLAKLQFISSAGLRVFATARKLLRERGGQTSFVNMQPQIQEVFDIIKALPGIEVFKDYAEMDAYLAARQKARLENP